MKKMLLTAAAATASMTVFAAPAAAQNPQTIEVVGTAEAFCSLPSSWTFASSTNNVSPSQYNSNTWTIPSGLITNASGQALNSSAEVAIRVRGQASCNTSHTITLSSANGGLLNGAPTDPTPAGFERSRRMEYAAHWRDQTSWGITGWVPASAGASTTYNHGARVPPGNREFDIRMEVLPDLTQSPMVAGSYSDQLTVTISVAG